MNEWEKPEVYEKLLAGLPPLLAALSKMRQSLSKRKGRKESERKLANEIDELREKVGSFIGIITVVVQKQGEIVGILASFVDTIDKQTTHGIANVTSLVGPLKKMVQITTLHGKRLTALEAKNGGARKPSGRIEMTRITRAEAANGIEGSRWYPALDDEGRHVLGRGQISEEAKRGESRTVVATEAEAVEKLRSGMYWIRMTAAGQKRNLIGPANILIDGQQLT